MAARKKATRSSTRSKAGARKQAPKTAFERFEAELPPDLRGYSRRVRRGLSRLEREIEHAQRDARRRWTKLLREASHQLGSIEAAGERSWRKRTLKARREAVKLLHRLEKAIEPPKKKAPRKKKTAKKSPRAKAAARPDAALPSTRRVDEAETALGAPPLPPPPPH